jgi:hypothetical protein
MTEQSVLKIEDLRYRFFTPDYHIFRKTEKNVVEALKKALGKPSFCDLSYRFLNPDYHIKKKKIKNVVEAFKNSYRKTVVL